MKRFFLSLTKNTSSRSSFLAVALLQQSETTWDFQREHWIYFLIGLILGITITLLISNYYLKAKIRKSLSHALTFPQGKENESGRPLVADADPEKAPPLHEKEIESLVRLASTLSHDLNNLIGSIMGYAALLKKKFQPETKEFHYTEIIENSSKQMAQLLRRTLGFSQPDAKTIKVVDLNQFVRMVSQEFSSVRGEKFNIMVSTAPQPTLVQGSTDQLNQVLLAIFDNAADSMKDGGTIECSISSYPETDSERTSNVGAGQCLIEIDDHGTGMSKEVKQRIFEPFFTTKGDKKYTGLSLSQVFNIVKQHGGTISVDSLPGVGTKVKIFLPLFGQEDATVQEETILIEGEFKGVKILVVDDEENVRQLGFDVLTEHGFHAITANNGLDALRKLKEDPDIKLVLMDMIMPVMTGKDACLEIKKMERAPKILICTGFSELSDLKTILGTYAEGLIRKPYNTRELIAAVENILRENP